MKLLKKVVLFISVLLYIPLNASSVEHNAYHVKIDNQKSMLSYEKPPCVHGNIFSRFFKRIAFKKNIQKCKIAKNDNFHSNTVTVSIVNLSDASKDINSYYAEGELIGDVYYISFKTKKQ